jgi:hypothetical protein
MAASQTTLTLSNDTTLQYKVSVKGDGYLLLQRSRNERTFKQCLFSNGWDILKPLLPSLAVDLHDGIEAIYQFTLHDVNPSNQRIKVHTNPSDMAHYVQLCFVDKRSGRSHSFWLNQEEFDVVLSHTYDISQHLGYKQTMTSADTCRLITKMRLMAREQCYGCEIDHPSQSQHMADGCIGDLQSIADRFIGEAMDSLDIHSSSQYAKQMIAKYQ